MRIPVLYQDEQLVAVDKPVGMPTHAPDPGDPYPGDALRALQAQLGLPYLGMHQRLDADTSGVLLFATDPAVNAHLAAAFAGGQVSKRYLALVHGAPRRSSGTIDAPIVRAGGGRYAIAAPGDPRGLAARTGYQVLATSPERAYTLLELRPAGGRTHQIRLHLRHAGMPVVGDVLYDPERQAPRLFLHAHRLELPHPTNGGLLAITAPAPPAFEEFVKSETALRAAAAPAATRSVGGRALEALIDLALARRAPLHADPGTTFYRLINGTPDGFPDLTVDRYDDVLVASSYDEEGSAGDAGMLASLMERSGATSLYVKHRPRQASQVSDEEVSERAPSQPSLGPPREELVAHEEGLAYTIRPGEGLSTGIFPDMRPTRARVRAWAAGMRVLNCFAYTCGFGLAATAGHAARVLNIDLSRGVLARRHGKLPDERFRPGSVRLRFRRCLRLAGATGPPGRAVRAGDP